MLDKDAPVIPPPQWMDEEIGATKPIRDEAVRLHKVLSQSDHAVFTPEEIHFLGTYVPYLRKEPMLLYLARLKELARRIGTPDIMV